MIWRPADLAFLKANYGTLTPGEIAGHLSRSVSQVYQAAARYGLVTRQAEFTQALERMLRHLHQNGLNDQEIADAMGMDRRTIRDRRADLGLSVNVASIKAAKRRGVKIQAERLGIKPGGQLRVLAFRRYAAESGWPEDLPPRAVQILNLLAREGPMSRKEICKALGMRWLGSRKSLKCRGFHGSYLAGLTARGLVIRLGRLIKGAGKGGSTNLYCISLTAERRA